jgi:hypothetical protein
MRVRLPAVLTLTITAVVLASCSNAGTLAPTGMPASQSGRSAVPGFPAAIDLNTAYEGPGHDSVLGKAVYVITFRKSGRSLMALLTLVNAHKQLLQTLLKGSETKYGYTTKAIQKCTGTVRGQASLDGDTVSGLYGDLKCDKVVHSGSFGADKTGELRSIK